ncbi:MAG: glycogen synthase GlgA [Firmicutes bacterium]|nr:glycogen synthase GlgA [Bacillota bacterium]
MRILLAAAEVNPFAKTGGLADVAASLSRAIMSAGHDIRVVLPAYRCVDPWRERFTQTGEGIRVRLGPDEDRAQIWEGNLEGLRVYLIGNQELYNRDGLYGEPGGSDYPDNARRFAFFCRAALEMLKSISFHPEVIHCNDWHTALIPVYLKTLMRDDPFYQPVRSVFTIHNLGYQGRFDVSQREQLGLDDHPELSGYLEFHGGINLMQGGIRAADLVTTVSPTYAREVQEVELGFGLEGEIRARAERFYGILNGIDEKEWNPESDPWISPAYNSGGSGLGKYSNKKRLRQELGLEDSDAPLLAVVSRLAEQKGIDLLLEVLPALLQEGTQVAVLGTGDPGTEGQLSQLAARFPGRCSFNSIFSNPLAHRIYAGADILMVPSRYEPCGLTQMIGLRYGTVPLVRATGGLADTVLDVGDSSGKGNGFVFRGYQASEMLETCQRALAFYRKPEEWSQLVKRGMNADYSWKRSALEYIALYYKVSVE